MGESLGPDEIRALKRKARSTTLIALQTLGGEAERAAITSRALKIGRWTQRELSLPGTGRHERRVESELSWALTDLKRAGLVTSPRRGVWAVAGAAADIFGPSPAAAPAPVVAPESVPPPFVATVSQPPPAVPVPVVRRPLIRRLLAG